MSYSIEDSRPSGFGKCQLSRSIAKPFIDIQLHLRPCNTDDLYGLALDLFGVEFCAPWDRDGSCPKYKHRIREVLESEKKSGAYDHDPLTRLYSIRAR
ncbi:MAG: hypothetical protein Q6353_003890 [Candidatus Sigynarchaeum springense]